MYIIIAGGGIAGRNLTKNLVQKHDVIVIEKEQSVAEKIYSRYGAVTVLGSATRIDILKEAGIEKCDIAIAVMRDDADNLSFSLLAKNFGVKKILVRMREPEYENAYQMAGATNIAATMELIVDRFITDIEEPDVRKVASLGDGKAEVSILTIPPESSISGMKISEIVSQKNFPENCVIAGIFDKAQDRYIVPRGNREIFAGNQVFLVASKDDMESAADFLLNKK
ncbi:trk system potassium uptake protein TrkA [Halanaerobium congolense]|jgi:trk system potassium uptake protein TrkA|uniref:Trk system potassium uptake protein TrkA n=1 Tax=Halanaerobium congolense TaxID=54121 RepID=A0A1M7GVV0_9FIRM|nr:NAD-binding protein [Halanaerobium congolense]KXS48914.1 MAG: trk system potassium uptake protein TrkA [Halanaerobium sp. T82-1]OEG62407.1 MAG: potassium transporter TrkA [Halanaerobium sp. MDAL1]PTX17086.1 trk system potassium uptake protein TrkA [Halanaerobium congolense]PXV69300.1 trk system potassium uptake protein TrkA [Halanaerobium congolense]TDP27146.1 trk system potassium uptake protein TrkA [Halanaerobium congolense]